MELGSEVPGERGGYVQQHLRLGGEGWLPINCKQQGEWYAGRDLFNRGVLIIHQVLRVTQGEAVVQTWEQRAGGGIGGNKAVSAREEWEWLASKWEGGRLSNTHWDRKKKI